MPRGGARVLGGGSATHAADKSTILVKKTGLDKFKRKELRCARPGAARGGAQRARG